MTFVQLGTRLHPYPLDTWREMQDGWKAKVNSATLDDTAEVEAVYDSQCQCYPNPPPPAGEQYTVVSLSMKNTGELKEFYDLQWIQAEGVGNVLYDAFGTCEPPAPWYGGLGLAHGQTNTTNLCFEIASSDANSLVLGVPTTLGDQGHFGGPTIRFALR